MKPYYQNNHCTIYHGDNACYLVRPVVNCSYENIHRRRNQGDDKKQAPRIAKQGCRYSQTTARTHERLQANGGARGSKKATRQRSSRMAWRGGHNQNRAHKGASNVPRYRELCSVRFGEIRKAPHRREHTQQRPRKRDCSLSQMPHERGRTA